MEKVKEVALYALKSSLAITDAHKVALCMRYNVGMDWAKDAIQRIISRSESLTDAEIEELITQPRMVGLISRTREALMRPATSVSLFGGFRYQVGLELATLLQLHDLSLGAVSRKGAGGDAALPRIQVYVNVIVHVHKSRCQIYICSLARHHASVFVALPVILRVSPEPLLSGHFEVFPRRSSALLLPPTHCSLQRPSLRHPHSFISSQKRAWHLCQLYTDESSHHTIRCFRT